MFDVLISLSILPEIGHMTRHAHRVTDAEPVQAVRHFASQFVATISLELSFSASAKYTWRPGGNYTFQRKVK